MRKLALSAAVEEVSDVRVLLSLSHAIVVDASNRKDIRQDVSRQLRRKSDRQRIGLVINREANIVSMRPVRRREIIETRYGEGAGDLARAVGPKVEEDYRITVLDGRHRKAVL